jgi:nucleotide-binding universal stress UspA family protein
LPAVAGRARKMEEAHILLSSGQRSHVRSEWRRWVPACGWRPACAGKTAAENGARWFQVGLRDRSWSPRTWARAGTRRSGRPTRSSAGYAVGVDTGSPHGGILRHAERLGAGLIVAGAGATATRVVRGASVPVLVARPSPAGRVLGATDFSDPSLPALRAAAGEAARRGVPLALLHSMDIPLAAYSVGLTGVPLPAVTPAIMADARTRLGDELKAFSGQPGADAECLIADGPPAKAILEAARALPAELIVVGTHGSTALTRLALGSVAEAVLSDAPCSVLVVRLAA